MGQLMNILSLLLKLWPLLLPILRGLIGGLNSLNEANKVAPAINQQKLEELIKQITITQVKQIVNAHKGEIQAWVPTPEEQAQEDKINNLLKILEADQTYYNQTHKKNPSS